MHVRVASVPLRRSVGRSPECGFEAAEIETLYITCDPENVASRRSFELAGAEFLEIVDVPADCIIHKTGHPLKCRYRIDLGAGS